MEKKDKLTKDDMVAIAKGMDNGTLSNAITTALTLQRVSKVMGMKDILVEDIQVLKDELMTRGRDLVVSDDGEKMTVNFPLIEVVDIKVVDLKVSAPVAMVIPSVSDLIYGLTCPDLVMSERY